jgi:hypothetical protein
MVFGKAGPEMTTPANDETSRKRVAVITPPGSGSGHRTGDNLKWKANRAGTILEGR